MTIATLLQLIGMLMVLALVVGIAANGAIDGLKAPLRHLWPAFEDSAVEQPTYVLTSQALCIALMAGIGPFVGSWPVLTLAFGFVAHVAGQSAYRWFLNSFLRRTLPAITRRAVDAVDAKDTEAP